MRKLTYSLIGLAFIAGAAHAQQSTLPGGPESAGADATASTPADQAPAASATAPTTPTADASAATTTSAYSDAEIDSFAKATVKVQAINGNAALSAQDKQTQMAAAVTEAGLDPAKYNKIGQALTTDTDLRGKVQVAMAKYATPNAG